jgi:hypothetical protein
MAGACACAYRSVCAPQGALVRSSQAVFPPCMDRMQDLPLWSILPNSVSGIGTCGRVSCIYVCACMHPHTHTSVCVCVCVPACACMRFTKLCMCVRVRPLSVAIFQKDLCLRGLKRHSPVSVPARARARVSTTTASCEIEYCWHQLLPAATGPSSAFSWSWSLLRAAAGSHGCKARTRDALECP